MEIEERRLIELRQSRVVSERNKLQAAITRVQRQHHSTASHLLETQSTFRRIFEDLKAQARSTKLDQQTKLDKARFSASAMKNIDVKLAELNKEVSVLVQRQRILSHNSAKLEKIDNRCQERIRSIKYNFQNQREISADEDYVEVTASRKKIEADIHQGYGSEASSFVGGGPTLNVQADGRSSNNQSHNGADRGMQSPQPQPATNQLSPFENIERIQAWQAGQLASVMLTYRLTSGRAINIEASQITGSKIQISLAPEFQQDRDKLLREKGRMMAALREAGVRVEGLVIL